MDYFPAWFHGPCCPCANDKADRIDGEEGEEREANSRQAKASRQAVVGSPHSTNYQNSPPDSRPMQGSLPKRQINSTACRSAYLRLSRGLCPMGGFTLLTRSHYLFTSMHFTSYIQCDLKESSIPNIYTSPFLCQHNDIKHNLKQRLYTFIHAFPNPCSIAMLENNQNQY